ncbi:hypothetical protein N0V95_005432 [Ascochyta clinopodiicola]|nr:hypothetical protein N0V95_005432 [Ascochyta clinopodiicola]
MFKEKTMHMNQLPALECDFSWDTEKLQPKIKAYKSDYNPQDPWTWPQLRSTKHPGYHDGRQNGAALPQGIVYPREIAHQFLYPTRPVRNMSWMMHGNVLFPFSYDGSGKLRTEDALGAQDRWNWMYKMTGARPAILEVEDDPEPESERPESTTGAFNEVIRMVNESYDRDRVEVVALRKEVTQLSALHGREKVRADKAETEVVAVNKACEVEFARANNRAKLVTSIHQKRELFLRTRLQATNETLEATSLQLSQRTKLCDNYQVQISAAAVETKTLKQSLKERDEEAQDLKNKAAVADEQVMKIWAEMKKVREAVGGKRKGRENESGVQFKKMKHV